MAYCGPKGIPLSEFLRWDQSDQDAALEWAAYEARRCGNCGTHPDEWDEGGAAAFHAHLTQCKGCQEQQRAAEAPEAAGRGVYAVVLAGPPATCPRCQPLDD